MARLPPSFCVLALALVAGLSAGGLRAEMKTVCTITVNSADEKEAMKSSLPRDRYRFVELVEKGRADWLASACAQKIQCDVLVISGHYDGGNEFFSEHIEGKEYLPVDEMERVSCGASCSGLFAKLKEVYLFGCNTMNPEANRITSGEVARSLVRSGHSRADAERIARNLSTRHGESSRDRMRQIFKDVPTIYGFSSVAPLGPTAGSLIKRYFQTAGTGDFGTGRVNSRLLGQFSQHSLAVSSGFGESEPNATLRRDFCHFTDDRLTTAQRVAFVHQLLGREMAEVRMFFERIERYTDALTDAQRQEPDVAAELAAIASDEAAKRRYMDFMRDADQLAVRARMIAVAGDLGWLSASEQRQEQARMIGELLAANSVSTMETGLVCALNKDDELSQELPGLAAKARNEKVSNAAVLACLGSVEGRARMLQALTSTNEDDVHYAQVYFRHRPITDVGELRTVTTSIARMTSAGAQIRALDTLAQHRLSDQQSLEELTRLYPVATSARVQAAIAGILIRSDYQKIANAELVQTLRRHRLKSTDGENLVDVLIRRLTVSL